MDKVKLEVLPRDATGKQKVKALRKEGFIPASLYGKNIDGMLLSISSKTVKQLLRTTSMRNTIFELKIKGKRNKQAAIVYDMQMHPVTREIVHIDLYGISMKEKVTVSVPVRVCGTAKGIEMGGVLVQRMRTIEVECLPADIPSELTIDVTEMEIGDVRHVSDLEAVNFEFLVEPERTVVTLQPPKVVTVAEEEEEEVVEGEEEDAEEAAEDSEVDG